MERDEIAVKKDELDLRLGRIELGPEPRGVGLALDREVAINTKIANRRNAEGRKFEKWDRRFLELAKHVSAWSKDPSTKVGAVIVNDDRIVLGMGYNGFPRGVNDDPERYNDRPTKYKLVVHAELNAVLAAGKQAQGSTIYVYPAFGTPPLCTSCAKAVIQAGITRVVGYTPTVDSETAERWREEIAASYMMCHEALIIMDMYDEEVNQ